jgi:hypothetical protein
VAQSTEPRQQSHDLTAAMTIPHVFLKLPLYGSVQNATIVLSIIRTARVVSKPNNIKFTVGLLLRRLAPVDNHVLLVPIVNNYVQRAQLLSCCLRSAVWRDTLESDATNSTTLGWGCRYAFWRGQRKYAPGI